MNDSPITTPEPQQDERTLLSYPSPGYLRIAIPLGLALLAYLTLRLAPKDWLMQTNAKPDVPGTSPFPGPLALIVFILGCSLLASLPEAIFLIGWKLNRMHLEFDRNNLYIKAVTGDRTIPFSDILFIRVHSGKRLSDIARSPHARYTIGFGDSKAPEQVRFTVFTRTRQTFSDFLKWAQEKNPAIEVTNQATIWDQ